MSTTNNTGNGEETGRYLILLQEDSAAAALRTMARVAGVHAASTADVTSYGAADSLSGADGLLLHDLGVAVVRAAHDQADALLRATAEHGPLARVEPERVVRAYSAPPAEPGESGQDTTAGSAHSALAESPLTWGLRAIGAGSGTATGAGVRVAVLDTGFTVDHPDFAEREVETRSFVEGEDVGDGHGHGTHCIGTACGPRTPGEGPGYGVAPGAEIYAGKVLSNAGTGTDGDILAGIAWAVSSGCAVVSLSLGSPTRPGEPHSETFETVARRAMRRNTLIVAAAGNESDRAGGVLAPVSHPANCPSILAVGAVDASLAVANFSCGTVDPNGAVDLVAPGVNVHSSWTLPEKYHSISGTSMATPHVAGVAALIAEKHGARGWELWARLGQSAHRLPLPSTDVGSGLVQAP
ncbi:S8 family serine peptidase [Saccharomonospora xinjiangensis]|uniref:S8 family serine peptidase n=1 Tax=Saccharomonospora xinjiangensis TaxID=75294 RepID=UPI00106F730A|nr:S8 family serine peptidase [Saccharomonospora xinjiangensis]QBQ60831.1 Subtilisin BL [Saccharomonospora xinjiangensis]